jgi:hypothetical protein
MLSRVIILVYLNFILLIFFYEHFIAMGFFLSYRGFTMPVRRDKKHFSLIIYYFFL